MRKHFERALRGLVCCSTLALFTGYFMQPKPEAPSEIWGKECAATLHSGGKLSVNCGEVKIEQQVKELIGLSITTGPIYCRLFSNQMISCYYNKSA